jgi:hypothetical protein
MRKIIWNKLIGLALLTVSFSACETAEQETAPVISPDNKPTATITPLTSYSTITEGDTVIYNVSIDKIIDRSITVTARQVEGTVDEDDYVVLPGVIQPYSNSTSVMIIFNADWDVEGAETAKFEFGVFGIADRYLLHTNTVNPTLNLTINNYVSDVVNAYFGWDTEFVVLNYVKDSVLVKDPVLPHYTYVVFYDTVEINTDTGYEMDFDIGISTAAGFDISNVWASDIVAGAFSGDNPEEVDIEGLDDGEYVIWNTLFMNWAPFDYDAIKDPTVKAPIVAYFERQGTDMAVEIIQPDDQAATVDVNGDYGPDYYEVGDNEPFEGIIAYIIVADGKYQIKEVDGTLSEPYKAGKLRVKRPAAYNHYNPKKR